MVAHECDRETRNMTCLRKKIAEIRYQIRNSLPNKPCQVLTKINVVRNILAQRPAESLGKFETHSLSALVHRDTVNDGVRSVEITILEISEV